MSQLSIALLGTFRVAIGATPITEFHSVKVRALLAYLAVESDRSHERDLLAGLFWSDDSHEQALKHLRQALHRLGQALEPASGAVPLIVADRQSVHLNPNTLQLDVTPFIDMIATVTNHNHRRLSACPTCITTLEQTAALYRGPFLAGFRGVNSLPFEEWIQIWRERIAQQQVFALGQLAEHHVQRREYGRAAHYLRQWLEIEPWREEAHRRQMEVLAYDGQRSLALAQFVRCRQALKAEFDVAPSPETVTLFRRIEAGTFDATPTRVRHAGTLPSYATPFVGRASELERLTAMLINPACRLLTLVGAGGSGKTRLAIEAAAAAQDSFVHGVRFVALANVPSPERLAIELMQSLGIADEAKNTPQQLCDYLYDKDMLLVLDNYEHLVSEARLLAQLLEAAPGLTLLVTSRELLHLAAEWLFPLDGLTVPPENWCGEQADYPVLQLFVQLARQVQPNFNPSHADILEIAQICRAVAGMPLAVALAAAHVQRHGPAAIAMAIRKDFDALVSELRDYPARHRSLRAVFMSSCRLLTQAEQRLLVCCSIFQGSFSSQAVDIVMRAEREAPQADASVSLLSSQSSVLGLLESLVHKSLVQQTMAGRYELHDLVRQYAAEQLETEAPELGLDAQVVRTQHSAYYLGLLAQHADIATSPHVRTALDTILVDLPNIRFAWQWAAEGGNLHGLAAGLRGLVDFYQISSLFEQGLEMVTCALANVRVQSALVSSDPQVWRLLCGLLIAQARMLYARGQYGELVTAADEAVTIARTLGSITYEAAATVELGRARWRQGNTSAAQDDLKCVLTMTNNIDDQLAVRARSEACYYLGLLAWNQGMFAEAQAHYEEALRLARLCGYRYGEGDARNNLALVALMQGDYDSARDSCIQALAIYRAIGYLGGEGIGLISLGLAHMYQGNYLAAQQAFEACREVNTRTGDRQNMGMTLITQGMLHIRLGNYQTAQAHLGEGVAISDAIGHTWGCNLGLAYTGLVAYLQGDHQTALNDCRRALEMSEGTHDSIGATYAFTHLGHIHAALGDVSAAVGAYEHALQLHLAFGQHHLTPDSLAGLARLASKRGDLSGAMVLVEKILALAATTGLAGPAEPIRIYLTCYHVLHAAADPRAIEVLLRAQQLLEEQAAHITDSAMQQRFLEGIDAHRELAALLGRHKVTGTEQVTM